ncbi:hypothetical protein GGX14DRAFT_398434 [Mycena pura]|uniref:Uncharacterized protein n=1 Tax=Mycena pura TaxID=153505 RepID=A0AAD6YBL0_9AGAR|nr:hypothetical protein GGX14DRAFT_398434 [Mycena pura]
MSQEPARGARSTELNQHEFLDESERPPDEDITVQPTSHLDPPLNVDMPTAFEGQPNPVLPRNGEISGQERRNDLQGVLGTAADEGAQLAQNSLHIDLLARKVPLELAEKTTGLSKVWEQFYAGTGSNPDAFTIKRANFQAYLQAHPDPVASRYAVVDLRNPLSQQDVAANGVNTQIKGALHEHVDEKTYWKLGDGALSISMETRNLKREVPVNTKQSLQAYVSALRPLRANECFNLSNWEKANQREPWKSLKDKDIVFFHCRESINRTPYIASGYLEYGRPAFSKQKVIIIERGFDNATNWPAGTTEPWNVNI